MSTRNNATNGQDSKYTTRKKTYFIDIDGTLLRKPDSGGQQWSEFTVPIQGMVEWVNDLEKEGHSIVLVTARRESHRLHTERMLANAGFCWDHLIMGLTNGERIVVNDGPCSAIRLETNVGFK
jgi:hypothetical protein